jgi:hypothetical protein
MKIVREKAGVLSPRAVWIFFDGYYMYISHTLWGLFKQVVTEWRQDKHIVG